MMMRVREHADDRGTLQSSGFDVPTVARQHGMTRGGQRDTASLALPPV
jgi:hypothetical protein